MMRDGIDWAFHVAEIKVVEPAPPRLFPLRQPEGALSGGIDRRRKLQQVRKSYARVGLKFRTLYMLGAFPEGCTLAPGQHRRNSMTETVSSWQGE